MSNEPGADRLTSCINVWCWVSDLTEEGKGAWKHYSFWRVPDWRCLFLWVPCLDFWLFSSVGINHPVLKRLVRICWNCAVNLQILNNAQLAMTMRQSRSGNPMNLQM